MRRARARVLLARTSPAGYRRCREALQAHGEPGDIVTRIGTRDVRTQEDLRYAVAAVSPNDVCVVEVLREGAPTTLQVTLDARPPARMSRGPQQP